MQIPGFQITRKISQGGMSSVYLAIQQSIGREVALKVMSPTLAQDPHFSERFQREATIVGQLSHPNIIGIYDIGKYQGLNYIAMDYLAKGSLSQRLRKGISGLEAVKILKQLAGALAHAHHCGYVHRDIKPENVLFRGDDSAVLSDFGVAKAIKQNLGVTHAGTVLGTPNYMSPEQAKGQPCDGRSDLYSLGVMFYEMLSGKLPFQAEEAVAIAIKHLTAPIPKLPTQHALFQPLLEDLLAKNPDERIQSGEELIERIEILESGLQIPKINYSSLSGSKELQLGTFQRLQAFVFLMGQKLSVLFPRKHSPADLIQQASRYTTAINEKHTSESENDLEAPAENSGNQSQLPKVFTFASALCLLAFTVYYNSSNNDVSAVPTENQRVAAQQTLKDVEPNLGDTEKALEPFIATPVDTSNDEPSLALNTVPDTELTANDFNTKTFNTPSVNAEAPAGEALSLTAQPATREAVEASLAEAVAEAPKDVEDTYPLTISSTPKADRIRILNIKPRYKAGISLAAGSYLVEISKRKFKTLKRWIKVSDKAINQHYNLEKLFEAGETFSDPLDNYQSAPEMIVVPTGSFSMGSKAKANSLPIRQVTIADHFAVSRFEISFADYQTYLDDTQQKTKTPDDNNWGRGNRPVININWHEAVAYTEWLSKKTGRVYRLLSEAEWEYIARANRAGNYWWPQNSRRMANCRRGCNSEFAKLFGSQTAPLGYYPANPFGIYDTSGNVAEWVMDCYTDHYLGASTTAEPRKSAQCLQKTVRGGSHSDNVESISSHSRGGIDSLHRSANIGFRILAEL
ncbi:bifunctional serine/threonine-protein kinase/formylglycine-generating enzyme family protein [Pseudoteredinibacter isoporae]|uniref:bifunctional serine/threonine-protein kinase/formylglycine-generating enzyme family protein n=1 Tax=Pseudoteredinibacter isoporae TaxID=570281 RepID=UPI0031087ED5